MLFYQDELFIMIMFNNNMLLTMNFLKKKKTNYKKGLANIQLLYVYNSNKS